MKTAVKTPRKKKTLMESFFSKVTKVWPQMLLWGRLQISQLLNF